MKRTVCMIAVALCALALTGCSGLYYRINGIPRGYTAKEEHFEKDAWQDSTDYCKYFYASPEPFEKDGRYRLITEDDVAELQGFFADFANWMELQDRMGEYDFDDSVLRAGNLVYIQTREGQPIGDAIYGKYDDYSIGVFDVENCVLYYIHANI